MGPDPGLYPSTPSPHVGFNKEWGEMGPGLSLDPAFFQSLQ